MRRWIKPRPLGFWLLLALFAALTLWWTFYVPFRPERLYAAIPAQAALVSEHRDLAGRWQPFLRNPLTQSLLGSLDLKPQDLQALEQDPQAAAWLRRLLGRDVVLAYCPALGPRAEPAWVLVSWIGGLSQQLRWALGWARQPGLVRLPAHGGRPIWRVGAPLVKSDRALTVALVEGMLIGCSAEHPETIHDLLDTVDGLLPSQALRAAQTPDSLGWCSEPQAPDRGWVHLAALQARPDFRPARLSYEIAQLSATNLEGQLCGAYPLPPMKPGGGAAPRLADLDRLLGDLPVAVLVGRAATVLPAIAERLPPGAGLLLQLIQQQRAGSMMLALFGEEYGGRLKGLRVPGLVIGASVKNPDAVLLGLRLLLDGLNGSKNWGLTPHAIAVGDHQVYAVEGVATNLLAGQPVQEQPAYTVCGNWLLLASNLQTLTNLVGRYDRPEAQQQAGAARWAQGLQQADAPVYGWIDLLRGEKTARLALMSWSLKLMLEDAQGTRRQRQQLNEAKAWLETIKALEVCQFWLRSDGQISQLSVKAGR